MQTEVAVGTIYQGTVKRITNYGAFVAFQPAEDAAPLTGMVHISEVSNRFVHDIHEFVTEGQTVTVKVIGVQDGKISLSMKQAEPAPPPQESRPQQRPQQQRRERPNVWQPPKPKPAAELSFEDMLNQFKQNSEERMGDIKRNVDRKNHTRRK